MHHTERLLRLLQCVPFHHVDEAKARAAGDHAALEYARACRRWEADAARAIAEAEAQPIERPNAFERILAAAEVSRSRPANANVMV